MLVGRGRKLEQGFAGLPAYLRNYVLLNRPEFASAPETYSQPNATAWTEFKRQQEAQRGTTQDVPAP